MEAVAVLQVGGRFPEVILHGPTDDTRVSDLRGSPVVLLLADDGHELDPARSEHIRLYNADGAIAGSTPVSRRPTSSLPSG